jgi:hypothetical protein
MTFPVQNITVQDPGIHVVPPAATTPVITGIAIGGSGAANTLLTLNRISDVRSILGYGPLAEDVALALQTRGGPVYAVKHTAPTALLTAAAMTQVGTGTPQPTVSGTPTDRFNLLLTIVAGGALGTGTFKFSLDAHDANAASFTQSQVRTIPGGGTYAIPNSGLTVTFPAGTYVAADTYALSTVPPEPSTTDLATVATLLENTSALDFHIWLLSGAQPDNVTAATLAAALSGDATALTQSYRYVRAFVDIGSTDTANNIHTEAASWTSTRVSPAYGFELIPSVLPYEGFSNRKTSCVSTIAVRAMTVPISNDLARFADGPGADVLKIYFDGFYDQRLDGDGISTMRTWPGIDGFYIAGGKLKAPFGSNFTDVQFGRIMDVACKTTYQAQLPYLADFFRATTDGTGHIDPRDAATVETGVRDALANELTRPTNAKGEPGHVSGFSYTVDQTVNIITTGQLVTKVGIVPFGYAKDIETTMFFTLTA